MERDAAGGFAAGVVNLDGAVMGDAVYTSGASILAVQGRQGTDPVTDHFRVPSGGGFVSEGFVRDVGNTSGCAAFIPATGPGTRFMWHPCRGALRFGRVPIGQDSWDDHNIHDFTFAGGNQVRASGYGSFAFGDQVSVTSTVGVGFGSGVTVSGTAGFSSGASNVCSGFACTAIGYVVRAGGQGSVALGYRVTANNDYSVALGYRASNNGRTGTLVLGDESTTDSVRNQADNEFRARYTGGFRLRVSTAANGNTPGAGGNVGCDLTAAVPTWTCASSRTVKHDFSDVDGEELLLLLRGVPIQRYQYVGAGIRALHIGPMAEDFHAAFGLGESDRSLAVTNLAGVNAAAVQALDRRTEQLAEVDAGFRRENRQLREESQHLRSRIDELEDVVAALLERLEALEGRSGQNGEVPHPRGAGIQARESPLAERDR